jgi:cytochrome c oxidase assembly factor CtaG
MMFVRAEPDGRADGLEPLTSTEVALRAWSPDWPMLAVGAILTVLYLVGRARVRRDHGRWPMGCTIAFLAGVLLFVASTQSFLGVYADTLFWVRATQLSAVFLVVPLLLALGRPLSLATTALNRPSHPAWLTGRPAHVMGHPIVGSGLLLVLPWVVFFSPWFEATMRSEVVDDLTLLVMLLAGYLYYWTRLQVDPVPRRFPPMLSLFIAFGEVVANAALGLALITGAGIIAPDYYAEVARSWGPSIAMDQKLGGGWYWTLGHVAGIPFVVITFWLARRTDAAEAAQIDVVLDRRHADEGERIAPWWEADKRFAHLAGEPTERDRSGDPDREA